eukprot:GFYU01001257.1.p2 GENE.GFYU01001257.1~~GFYU01001257.1.p2  ORF type:complete len:682 (+),score=229.41 GFYU01001257.1:660-2705(+)
MGTPPSSNRISLCCLCIVTMGCCGEDASEPKGSAMVAGKNRVCRDGVFAVLFVGFWVGMLVVGGMAFSKGDIKRLNGGMDDRGNFCGEGINSEYKYLYFPDPSNYHYRECIKNCWTKDEVSSIVGAGGNFCQKRRDSRTEGSSWSANNWQKLSTNIANGGCGPGLNSDEYYIPYAATSVLNICFPSFINETLQNAGKQQGQTTNSNMSKVKEFLSGPSTTISRLFDDVYNTFWVVIVAMIVAVVLGFGWCFCLKKAAGTFVWVSCALVMGATWGLTLFIYTDAQKRKDELSTYEGGAPASMERTANAVLILSYIMMAASVILLILLIFFRKRIQITIGVVKEASAAIGDMPFIIGYPIITFLLMLALMLWWVFVALFLASAGTNVDKEIDGKPGYKEYTFDDDLKKMIIYHLFGGLWTAQFILALSEIVIAGAVANWYWCKDKKDVGDSPVKDSFTMAIRYYLGSIALGSLIIAIIQMIRIIFEYIDYKIKNQEGLSDTVKKVWGYIACVFRCCLWCLEKCMKFINRNAYILIAVYGKGFCSSAKQAFFLILNNAARMAAVNLIGDFLLFLGKVIVACFAGLVAYLLLGTIPKEELSSVLLPTLVTLILAYGIGAGFMSVYELAIDTVLLCFCKDCEINGSNPQYCSKALKDILGGVQEPKRSSLSQRGSISKPGSSAETK